MAPEHVACGPLRFFFRTGSLVVETGTLVCPFRGWSGHYSVSERPFRVSSSRRWHSPRGSDRLRENSGEKIYESKTRGEFANGARVRAQAAAAVPDRRRAPRARAAEGTVRLEAASKEYYEKASEYLRRMREVFIYFHFHLFFHFRTHVLF